MKQRWSLHLLLALLATWSLDAAAQAALTLHGGWRTSSGLEARSSGTANTTPTKVSIDDSGFGSVILGWSLDASRDLELLYSQQRSDVQNLTASNGRPLAFPLTVRHLQIGGTNFFEGPLGTGPYVTGGIGVSQLSPGLDGFSSETRPSMSFGLGYQWLVGGLMLRAEARGQFVLVNSSGGLFCDGGCVVLIQGDTLQQFEASVGIGWRF